ncbi:hypothetical protein B1808_08260 [Pseudofulvimonas gallinarii]|nr:hypothetical protein B1808_08260 [Pseudofulvimonas gallinarii]
MPADRRVLGPGGIGGLALRITPRSGAENTNAGKMPAFVGAGGLMQADTVRFRFRPPPPQQPGAPGCVCR